MTSPKSPNGFQWAVVFLALIALAGMSSLASCSIGSSDALTVIKKTEQYIDLGIAISQSVVNATVLDPADKAATLAIVKRVQDGNQAAERITSTLTSLDTTSKAKLIATLEPVIDELTADVEGGALPIKDGKAKTIVELSLVGVKAALITILNNLSP